ncbi:dihydroorotase [Desulfuribacillus alkaliarsenatis]|uniref:Dihydroorotase n=1 Tax=Desulfuribacillus alkaliarsenatis TaxID=766136 RepID=A0A1E5G079_9FIRM|nr:dihydroorotase [Desulfuribacillus alkaliarsenatis]OEF96153.1 hypothetical protein BHF68_09930 [Desulfuribacillus alkaliarsenatis]
MAVLIKNVQLFDGRQLHKSKDILIENEKIVAIEDKIDERLVENAIEDNYQDIVKINAAGKLLTPGFIDMHVHLREPGFEYKETIETGSKAAAKGGFTTIACMPNTKPVTDSKEIVEYIYEKANVNNGVKVYPIGAITIGEKGQELTNFQELKDAGIIALSDDGRGVQNAKLMQEAFNNAKSLEIPIIIHAEDDSLAASGHLHDGQKAKELNIKGIPSTSESIMVARDILLAESAKAHVHFAHLSAKESVDWIEVAKAKGIHVTCEVTPQHLVMCDEDILEDHGNYKVNPPIRSNEDQNALIDALNKGVIDIIATDHAPHSDDEKNSGIEKSYFGMTGLETAFAVLYTKLVLTGKISLERVLESLTSKPAEIFNINRGHIFVGSVADMVLIDLNDKKVVEVDKFESKGKNSPFINWDLHGWPVLTMVAGKVIYKDERV